MSTRWRRIALKIVGHASRMLPGARSDWADAMRREIDYIEDDGAALRWAAGCVTASYGARLAALPRPRWQVSLGPVMACSLVLLVAMALQGHASDEAMPPALNQTICDLRGAAPVLRPQQNNRSELDRQIESDKPPCSRGTAPSSQRK
jgi:hypothetical protein